MGLPAAVALTRRPRVRALGGGVREHRADDPQPGAVRISRAVRRDREDDRNRRSVPLRAAADSAEYADGDSRRRPRGLRVGGGDGHDPRQILWQVELPLAVPSIVAGLRIATVTTIGTATIAAAIGARRPGRVHLPRHRDVRHSAPCWPARFPRRSWRSRPMRYWNGSNEDYRAPERVAAGCRGRADGRRASWSASKNFTEQVLLGEILAQQIERRLGCRSSAS